MAEDAQQTLEQFEMACFQIVAQVGGARSCYLEAISHAEGGDFEGAQKLIEEGDVAFNAGHDVHMGLLQREASGEQLPFRIILLHAEDQLMSAEGFRILAERFITVYRQMREGA
ncbi:PTS lactose/cellobiose transporter subunit IIA [Collinsella sp. An271]|uniref:PTS lactose/cellobiose transporter subunit IIA n=1 Tax=Collinsella ihumii TaxID=1720204 RepID=A0A921LRV6_9ACTN|nr:PTS lactose/cellobiose transporter subunit IIA [Collinsella sp. An271]OUO62190.1 PTS lactose/cellobiose transporter subunit IIA [Collinsella sp. An271]HJG31405.1 PTS lactose/cellobiose transporter subunit IIA [Collinsella ihumii]